MSIGSNPESRPRPATNQNQQNPKKSHPVAELVVPESETKVQEQDLSHLTDQVEETPPFHFADDYLSSAELKQLEAEENGEPETEITELTSNSGEQIASENEIVTDKGSAIPGNEAQQNNAPVPLAETPIQAEPIIPAESTTTYPDGSDLELDKELTPEQKEKYQWELVWQRFEEVNKGVSDKLLAMWIRKQLKNGWTPESTVVPDIHQVVITPVTHYYGKKAFIILNVQAFSYNDAYRATAGSKDYWYWITPIYGKKSKLQLHGSVTKFNSKAYGNLDQAGKNALFKKLFAVCGNQELYDAALKAGSVGGWEFIRLVKAVQQKYYGDDKNRVTGMLDPATLKRLEGQLDLVESKKTFSYFSDRNSLILNLFFISGDFEAYKKVMAEEKEKPQDQTTKPNSAAFAALVKSAQSILFADPQQLTGSLNSATYEAMDKWNQLTDQNLQQSDLRRAEVLTQREYAFHAVRRQQLDQEITVLETKLAKLNEESKKQNDANLLSNADSDHRLEVAIRQKTIRETEDRLKLLKKERDRISWAGLKKKNLGKGVYGDLKHNTEVQKTMVSSPFFTTMPPIEARADKTQVNQAILLKPLQDDPDLFQDDKSFYDNFLKSSQDKLKNQIESQKQSNASQRAQLLKTPELSNRPETALYQELLELYRSYHDHPKFKNQSLSTKPIPKDHPEFLERDHNDYFAQDKQFGAALPYQGDPDLVPRKKAEFDQLITALNYKAMGADMDGLTNSSRFYLLLRQLFEAHQNTDNMLNLSDFSGQAGNYSVHKLFRMAQELTDNMISDVLLSGHENPQAAAFYNSTEKEKKLRQSHQEYGGNVKTIPCYLLLSKKLQQELYAEEKRQGRQPDQRIHDMAHAGIPVDVFLSKKEGEWVLQVDFGTPGGQHQRRTDGNKSEDEALNELFHTMEVDNVFPDGMLSYLAFDKTFKPVYTHSDHWTVSEVLGLISLVLMISAIPFTGGASMAGTVLLTGSIITGVASVGFDLYEQSEAGTLGTGDAVLGGLSILASLLPGGAQLAKMNKLGQLSSKLAFLEGKRFLTVSTIVSGTDNLVQGYIITDAFVKNYEALKDLKDEDFNLAFTKLLTNSLITGALTYHAFKADLNDLKALNQPLESINPGVVSSLPETQVIHTGATASTNVSVHANHQPVDSQQFNREAQGAHLTIGNQVSPMGSTQQHLATDFGGLREGGMMVSEFRVTYPNGDFRYFEKLDFLHKINSGEFDQEGIVIRVHMEDKAVKEAMVAYEQRNKHWLTAESQETVEAILEEVTVQEEVLAEHQTNSITNKESTEIGGTGNSTSQNTQNVGGDENPVIITRGNRSFRNNNGDYEELIGGKWEKISQDEYKQGTGDGKISAENGNFEESSLDGENSNSDQNSIFEVENNLRLVSNAEHVYIIDNKGHIRGPFIGDLNKVDMNHFGPYNEGDVITHNHPSGSGFSFEDVSFLSFFNVTEIRAVTANKTYSLRKTGEFNYYEWRIAYDELQKWFAEKYKDKIKSGLSGEQKIELQSQLFEESFKGFNVEFKIIL